MDKELNHANTTTALADCGSMRLLELRLVEHINAAVNRQMSQVHAAMGEHALNFFTPETMAEALKPVLPKVAQSAARSAINQIPIGDVLPGITQHGPDIADQSIAQTIMLMALEMQKMKQQMAVMKEQLSIVIALEEALSKDASISESLTVD